MDPEISTCAPALECSAPVRVGRYRLIAHIGQGGMANVFLAVAENAVGIRQRAVLKLIRSEFTDDPELRAMFLDEARLSAHLHHPNIVRTHEVDRDGDLYYIAMEYLDGQPLHRVLRQCRTSGEGSLSTSLALRVMAEVLAGAHYAHGLCDHHGRPLGVVHRDISPQNIFLTYTGEVKLMDFGVAKARMSSIETQAGTLKGKLGYMPPEQALGDAVDARADVFAAGVVLFECLTGRRFWSAESQTRVLADLVDGRVPRMRDMHTAVDPEVVAIVDRATEALPANRYSSAGEMQLAIESILDREHPPVSVRGLGTLVGRLFAEQRSEFEARVNSLLRRLEAGEPLAADVRIGAAAHFSPGTPSNLRMQAFVGPALTLGTAHTLGTAPTQSAPPPAPPPATRRWLVPVASAVSALLLGVLGTLWWIQTSRSAGAALVSQPKPFGMAVKAERTEDPCTGPNRPVVELSGELDDDAVLGCDRIYHLRFNTIVPDGITLTLAPGTELRGDRETRGSLVVQPGGRLIARGTREHPIVFTSSQPPGQRHAGDWGGVFLLGRAPVNARDMDGRPLEGYVEGLDVGGRYGGDDPDDDSGILRHVRIEYGGIRIGPNNEINGLTLAGVGRGTTLDHIHVRETSDDCFEFFGGTVDARHLICDDPGDDFLDWDLGYQGRLQFVLLRDHAQGPDKTSALEGDNDPDGRTNEPRSRPVIFNATFCGSGGVGERKSYGISVRRGSGLVLRNALVSGFHQGLEVRDPASWVDIDHTLFFGQSHNDIHPDASRGRWPSEFLRAGNEPPRAIFTRPPDGIDCRAGAVLPRRALTQGAVAPPHDGFFDRSANFLGAFRDLHDGWAEDAATGSDP